MKLDVQSLREEAERRFADEEGSARNLSAVDALSLQHELGVHQIELELQNKQLRRTLDELEAAREKYFDLYDLAPVGYALLTDTGFIQEANLTLASRLGVSRTTLIGRPLNRFVDPTNADAVTLQLRRLFKTGEPSSFEVGMVMEGGTPFQGRLDAVVRDDSSGSRYCRVTLTDVTERKQAEQALWESNARLSLFVEHAPAELAMFDRDMRYLVASHRWKEIYRLGDRTLLGVSHYEVFPEIGETWKAVHRRALAGETIRNEGEPFPRADGSVQWLRWEVLPWTEQGGSVGGILIFSEDITGAKRAEEALRLGEERLRLSLEAARMGAYHWIVSTEEIVWSDMYRRLFGLPHGSPASYDRWLACLHPDDREPADRTVQRAMQDRTGFQSEYRIRRANDGAERWIAARGSFFYDEAGTPVRMEGVVSDVTEAREAAEAVRASEERFRRLFEESIVGMVLHSTDLMVIEANEAFADFLGYSCDEIAGMSIRDFTHPAHIEADTKGLAALFRGETTKYQTRKRYLRKDGATVWGSLGVVAIHDSRGAFLHSFATIEDVTAVVEAEESLRQSFARLVTANMELARTSRMKDEFIATMSHELRTPLGVILTMSGLLQEELDSPLPPSSLRKAKAIEESGRNLLSLVNSIIDFARIDAGKVQAETESVSVADAARAALAPFGETAELKRVEPSLSIDPRDLQIVTDGQRLVQLLRILVGNAVKFTPEEGRVAVEAIGDPAAGKVRISVRDTGIGIDKANLARIFEPFVQLDARISRAFGGAGMGLALASRLARLIGASIDVESEVGKGSTFTVSLPWSPPGKSDGEPAGTADSEGTSSKTAESVPPQGVRAQTPLIPREVWEHLREAIVSAHLDRIDVAVERLAHHDPETGQLIRELLDRFEYEKAILQCGRSGSGL